MKFATNTNPPFNPFVAGGQKNEMQIMYASILTPRSPDDKEKNRQHGCEVLRVLICASKISGECDFRTIKCIKISYIGRIIALT